MTSVPAPRRIVAMLHVSSVPRSIEFYARLGFQVFNTFTPDAAPEPAWAYLAHGDAHLMVTKASAPVVPEQQAVIFYLYFDDVAAVHAALAAEGLAVGPLSYPFYCPRGEFRLLDPDGYGLMLAHT